MSNLDQQHPRANKDSIVINNLLNGEPTEHNLAELARLTIRYQGFPGARTMQQNLQRILSLWQLTEQELFAKTLAIHQKKEIYRDRFKTDQKQDWT